MGKTMDLSKVSNEDLIRELTSRPGIVLDIWGTEDVLPTVEDDDSFDPE
jgi:hypothetical protein